MPSRREGRLGSAPYVAPYRVHPSNKTLSLNQRYVLTLPYPRTLSVAEVQRGA